MDGYYALQLNRVIRGIYLANRKGHLEKSKNLFRIPSGKSVRFFKLTLITMNTKIYEFTQNNSGGGFATDDKVCHRVLIEALNEDHACDIAENMGIYFNGCDTGHDCPCCGDRWYRPWDSIEFPYIYGHFKETEAQAMVEKYNCISAMVEKPKNGRVIEISFPTVASYAQYLADNFGWTVPDVRVFYLDGTVEEFYTPNTKPDESKTAKKG